jgi:hypothetical protein
MRTTAAWTPQAWSAIADGYELALRCPDISERERGHFLRMHRKVRAFAGESPLGVAPSPSEEVAPPPPPANVVPLTGLEF